MGATFVTAIVLVPSMRLLLGVNRISDRLELQHTMEQVCANKVHEALAKLTSQFLESRQSGLWQGVGHQQVGYEVMCSEQSEDGGIPGQLMAVQAIAWHDRNNDGKRQDDEAAVTLATKLARLSGGA